MNHTRYILLIMALFMCPAFMSDSKAAGQELMIAQNAGPALDAAGKLLQYPVDITKTLITAPFDMIKSLNQPNGLLSKAFRSGGKLIKFPFQLAAGILTMPFRILSVNPR